MSRDPMRPVTITLPLAHWRQIVSDIENMCGVGADEIEILSGAVLEEVTPSE